MPLNNVNLFAMELIHNVLNTNASQAHTGANGINAVLYCKDSNLAPRTRLSCDVLYLDGAVIYLRNLHLK